MSSRQQELELRLRDLLEDNGIESKYLEELLEENQKVLREAHLWPHVQRYNADIAEILGRTCPAPTYFFHSSWDLGTRLGDLHNKIIAQVFISFEEMLLEEIHQENVPGSVIEFGVYEGWMLARLLDKADSLGMKREFYGFDSFEGLSEPSKEHDYDEWKRGQFSATYELAAKNVRLADRPYLSLIKGWVRDSLRFEQAKNIKDVAYARIDVDIYPPTVDCLQFLSDRLVDRAVLVFDDWAYTSEKGESKAFLEWAETVPHYKFEWLGQCSSRFYLRVHRS